MKKITMLFVMLVIAGAVRSQDTPNFNEVFKQKKTQIKYLVEQIAALQVYLGYLKKGYEIVDKGLTTVGNIKDGTFNQDKDYLNSLKTVNPIIRKSPQVEAILKYQQNIVVIFQRLRNDVEDNEHISSDEKAYIQRVQVGILEGCNDSIDELTLILRDNYGEMKDDERLLRLNKVHEDMLDKYSFAKTFSASTKLLCIQRVKDAQEIQTTRTLIN